MQTYKCKHCGKVAKATRQKVNKYCSNACQREFEYKERVAKWIEKGISWRASDPVPKWPRRYLLQIQKDKCARCGHDKDHIKRPLKFEYNHIDGNRKNNEFKNGEMICLPCHSYTHTYRAKDRTKVTEEQKNQEAEHILKLLKQRKDEPLPEPTLH